MHTGNINKVAVTFPLAVIINSIGFYIYISYVIAL